MVWISEEAFEYISIIQKNLKEQHGYETPKSKLVSKAILNGVSNE